MHGACLISPRVIVRISAEVTTPLPERKFDGVFQIVTEFSPMASPAFEVGRYIQPYIPKTKDLPN